MIGVESGIDQHQMCATQLLPNLFQLGYQGLRFIYVQAKHLSLGCQGGGKLFQ